MLPEREFNDVGESSRPKPHGPQVVSSPKGFVEASTNPQGREEYTPSRVLEAAFNEDAPALDGFREAFKGMSRLEQVDFVRRLNHTASDTLIHPSNYPYLEEMKNGEKQMKGRVLVDATIQTRPDGTEAVHDLDIVTANIDKVKLNRTDLYTPEGGAGFDKEQEMKSKLAPYMEAYKMLYQDRFREQPGILSKEYWLSDEERQRRASDAAAHQVAGYIKQAEPQDLQKQADMLWEFNRDVGLFDSSKSLLDVGRKTLQPSLKPLDSSSTGTAYYWESQAGVRNLPIGLQEDYWRAMARLYKANKLE